jgi:uncharacterized RDD family membrane protein YckC
VSGVVVDGSLVAALTFALGWLGVFGRLPRTANWLDPDDWVPMVSNGTIAFILLTAAILGTAYAIIMHGMTGTTVGKRLMGCRLVALRGHLSWTRVVVRGLLAMVGTLALGVGPAWILLTGRQRALHDLLTATMVGADASGD